MARPPVSLEISNYVEIVDELLSRMKLSKLAIGGNSMGGWIAMRIASIRPERVQSLILEDSAGVSDPSDDQSFLNLNFSGIPVLIVWGINDRDHSSRCREVPPLEDKVKFFECPAGYRSCASLGKT